MFRGYFEEPTDAGASLDRDGLTSTSVFDHWPSTRAAASTLYAGTDGGGVFQSTNSGTSWTAVNTGLTSTSVGRWPSTRARRARSTPGPGAGVFQSTNSGGSWTAVNTGLTNTDVCALAIDPSTPSTLYAGTEWGGVFQSTNSGTSWTAVNRPAQHGRLRAGHRPEHAEHALRRDSN